MADLAPPTETPEDPGAHELHESSDEHFSDASEGRIGNSSSPIPTTRVERVDDQPAHGEVPGTAAYKMRTQDAVPDELEVVPEGQRSRSASQVFRDQNRRPSTPGSPAVPKLVVEKVEPEKPSHGEVPGTEAYEMRKADATPDEVTTSPVTAQSPFREDDRPSAIDNEQEVEVEVEAAEVGEGLGAAEDDFGEEQAQGEEDGFGDDFDDFEEGGGDEDDDFGDFGDIADEPATPAAPEPVPLPPSDPLSHLPHIKLDDTQSLEETSASIMPYLQDLFPETDVSSISSKPGSLPPPEALLSDRSASLWSQLVAPPPLQPPNWIRSRIRRLFLVSLGVPVDLDEILPASKQKKLILPSIHLTTDTPRDSSNLARIKKENVSSTSLDSTGPVSKEKRKKTSDRPGPPPPPEFDSNAASLLCSTTDTAMTNFTDEELKAHVEMLEGLQSRANEVLEYWVKRKESAVGDKEAFEGVIENLVGFVKKSKLKR
ncbi:hypothetical protein MBLNU457_2167t1 [Dothideomycetes sp. NU457]